MLSAKSLLYSSSDQCDLKVGESSKCAVLKCVDQSGNFRTFSLLCNNASIHTAGITVYFILFFYFFGVISDFAAGFWPSSGADWVLGSRRL